MPAKTLSDEAQIYVVQALASFESPSDVVKQVKEHFKFTISLPAILHYDPTKAQGRDLSEDLTKLFYECREQFKTEVENIPCANKAFRLRSIQRVIEKAEGMGAVSIVLNANEQAAKEMGGQYVRKETALSALPAPTGESATADVSGLSAEELANLKPDELIEHYRRAIGKGS